MKCGAFMKYERDPSGSLWLIVEVGDKKLRAPESELGSL
jgi:hypothetical protein